MKLRQIALVVSLGATHRTIMAQSPLAGFWTLSAKECVPQSSRCTARETGPWKSQLAIDVQHDAILVSTSSNPANPMAPAHTDTFRIDGKIVHWLPGQRGVSRGWSATKEPDFQDQKVTSPRPLWPGESWLLSADGKALLHEYQWKQGRDSTSYRMSWTYRRSAG